MASIDGGEGALRQCQRQEAADYSCGACDERVTVGRATRGAEPGLQPDIRCLVDLRLLSDFYWY